jgi:hypothetical protein
VEVSAIEGPEFLRKKIGVNESAVRTHLAHFKDLNTYMHRWAGSMAREIAMRAGTR